MQKRYSPTQAGYEAWLWDDNYGTFDQFLEFWSEKGRAEIIFDIQEQLNQLSIVQLQEIYEYIESNYF